MSVSKYRESFFGETAAHLQSFAERLLELEQAPGDDDVLACLLRSVHTLKGMAAAMGYAQAVELAHEMEGALVSLGEHRVLATPSTVDLLFKCQDQLQALVAGGRRTGSPGYRPLILALRKIAGPEAPLPGASQFDALPCREVDVDQLQDAQGEQVFMARFVLAPDTVMKAPRVFMVFKRITDNSGEVVRTVPPLQDLRDERFGDRFDVVFITRKPEEVFMESLNRISDVSLLALERLEPGLLQQQAGRRERGHSLEGMTSFSPQTVRVGAGRLDRLSGLAGELAAAGTRVGDRCASVRDPGLQEALQQLESLISSLLSVVQEIRMIPVKQVIDRYTRMVRDLSRRLGKDISLVVRGAETELDSSVAGEIGEVLVHLLRNAVDHGIEPPQERASAGKSNPAILNVTAGAEGNEAFIEIADDGRGVDLDLVRRRAVERGLLAPGAEADAAVLLNLLFEPGFSTVGIVTELSGRGLGLDIVRNRIASLGGSVALETIKGQGTSVKIRLPLDPAAGSTAPGNGRPASVQDTFDRDPATARYKTVL